MAINTLPAYLCQQQERHGLERDVRHALAQGQISLRTACVKQAGPKQASPSRDALAANADLGLQTPILPLLCCSLCRFGPCRCWRSCAGRLRGFAQPQVGQQNRAGFISCLPLPPSLSCPRLRALRRLQLGPVRAQGTLPL